MKKKLENQMKMEVAAELGLLEKAKKSGWSSLSAKETGRIGGIIHARNKAKKEV